MGVFGNVREILDIFALIRTNITTIRTTIGNIRT